MDVDFGDLAKLGHVREDLARLVGVDVDLVLAARADDELAAPHRGHEVVNRFRVDALAEEQELGAVQVLIVVPIVHRLDGEDGG